MPGDLPELESSSSSQASSRSALPPGVTVMTIRPLYSPGQIGAATFFGGPVGGGWLLALNFQRLGAPRKARLALGFSVLALAGVIALALAFPMRSKSLFAIVSIIVMSTIARTLQGEAFERHVALGGRRGSSWRAIGVGLASLALTASVIGAIAFSGMLGTNEINIGEINIGRSNVLYGDGVTRAEAQAVGDALVALGGLSPDVEMTVEVRRDQVLHIVSFVLEDPRFSDEDTKAEAHALAEGLSRRVFGGGPVDIWLVDGDLEPHVKLTWETRPR